MFRCCCTPGMAMCDYVLLYTGGDCVSVAVHRGWYVCLGVAIHQGWLCVFRCCCTPGGGYV